ncbi:MAG: dipicolinate synthase subunit B [Clostridia bacterium]|nr:dipicolinate synthase subunit B [Clostridia bacterium]
MNGLTVGFALCGSFCTFRTVIPYLRTLAERGAQVVPILSETAYSTDTRFGSAASFRQEIETICGREIIHTQTQAEPIGPKKLLDLLIVAPCTGNTLGKLANGITDSVVTLAVKAHLRNGRPVLLAVSTNDALGASAQNIGRLLTVRHIYFVPMGQDDPANKPASVVADFARLPDAAAAALRGEQLRPVLCG